MSQFDRKFLDEFLAVVRKYMQIRGGLSQKDLAELCDIGVSTLSRFLNQKTKDLDERIIAKIVAKLQIPLPEIVDFIRADDIQQFLKLVRYYHDEKEHYEDIPAAKVEEPKERVFLKRKEVQVGKGDDRHQSKEEIFSHLSPRQKAYITDFLNLDDEGRDLMVDLGNSLFRYFRQKGVKL